MSTIRCETCGVEENAHLIDAKPSDGDWEDGDYDRCECIACYGPRYAMSSPAHLALSIVPRLRPFYERWIACEVMRQHRHIVWC